MNRTSQIRPADEHAQPLCAVFTCCKGAPTWTHVITPHETTAACETYLGPVRAPQTRQRHAIASVNAIPEDFVRPFGDDAQFTLAEEAHLGNAAGLSCRLCLIACNSRKFTRRRCQAFNRPTALEGSSR
jgi:hypothetical protein